VQEQLAFADVLVPQTKLIWLIQPAARRFEQRVRAIQPMARLFTSRQTPDVPIDQILGVGAFEWSVP